MVCAVLAQSPDKILKQAVTALGGEKNLKRITSTQTTGKLVRKSDDASGTYQTFASQPDLYAVIVDIGGFDMCEGYNSKSVWRRDLREGLRALTEQLGTDFRAETLSLQRLQKIQCRSRKGKAGSICGTLMGQMRLALKFISIITERKP